MTSKREHVKSMSLEKCPRVKEWREKFRSGGKQIVTAVETAKPNRYGLTILPKFLFETVQIIYFLPYTVGTEKFFCELPRSTGNKMRGTFGRRPQL